MKKLAVVFAFLLLGGSTVALEANINPSDPSDLVFDGDYAVNKTFDGAASIGEVKSYSWSIVESSQVDQGPEAEFQFTEENDQTNTVRLMISNGTHSDMAEVTQVLHDIPQVSGSASDTSLDLKDHSGEVDFSADVTNYFDGPLSYEWRIDGELVDQSQSFTYDFDEAGEKNVEVNVTDSANYYGTWTQTIDVENTTEATESTSSGGAALPEDYDETHFFGDISKGETDTGNYEESPIREVTIEAAEDIEAARLRSRASDSLPDAADEMPQKSVYKYVEFLEVNFTDSDVEKVDFKFRIEDSWLEDKKDGSVELMRYDNGWKSLDTSQTGVKDNYVWYNASSGGLSVFSIAAEQGNPDLKVRNVNIEPSAVSPGETVKISFEVENTGEADGEYTASFEVAGQTLEKTIKVPAGETKTGTVETTVDEEGSYDFDIGSKSSTLQVENATATTASTTETTNSTQNNASQPNNEGSQEGSGSILHLFLATLIVLVIGGGALLAITHEERALELLQELEATLSELKDKIETKLGIKNEQDGIEDWELN